MAFEDMVASARKWVPVILEKERPDLLVGLFHSGVDYSIGGAGRDSPLNENAAQLVAERVPGFDLVFVGHDHLGWDGQGWDPAAKGKIEVRGPDGRKVPIFGASSGIGLSVPVVDVALTRDPATGAWVKSVSGRLVPLQGFAEDPAFVAEFKPAYDEVSAWLSKPIGRLVGSASTRDSMFGDSAFTAMIHRMQLDLSADPSTGLHKADISFAAPLVMDGRMPAGGDGGVYARDLFDLVSYENYLYTMSMTGRQVRDYLEYSCASWFDGSANPGGHLIAFQRGKDGEPLANARTGARKTTTPYYNYDSAAGIRYSVDLRQPQGRRVRIESMEDGRPFELDRSYVVVMNSYRGSGGGGHLVSGAGLGRDDVATLRLVDGACVRDLRYCIMTWLARNGQARLEPRGNWRILPEAFAAAGKSIDLPLLLPPR